MEAPSRVRSLVLIEPPAFTLFTSDPPRPGELLRLLLTRPRTAFSILRLGAFGAAPAAAALKKGDRERAMEVFGRAALGKETFESLSEEQRAMSLENMIEGEFLGSGFPRINPDRVASVEVPVLLMEGEESRPLFHRIADRLEELLPDCQRQRVAGVSHIIQQDAPERFTRSVTVFVDDRFGRVDA